MPIIALTAHAMKGNREVCIQAGMDDSLTKPLDPDKLARTLMKWMNVARSVADTPEAPAVVEAQAPRAVSPDPIDFPSLLVRFMNRADLAGRLVKKFLTLVRSYTAEIADAVAQQDADAVRFTAYRLKGTAASVSALAVNEIAAELEILGRENALDAAPDLVGRLEEEVERLIRVHGEDDCQAA